MVDIMGSAKNGSHTHDSVFVYLEAEERTVQIFFYHLGGMQVIANILVFGIFFKGVFPFDCVEFLLLGLKHTVQVDQALFLLFQFHFLHQADACTASFKRFGIEHLDAVNQNLRFIVVAEFKRFAGSL